MQEENMHHYCVCLTESDLAPDAREALKHTRTAILRSARWNTGANISIRFLAGDEGLKKRVRNVAMEWISIANLRFMFVEDGPTDIRIAFIPGNGSWSYLGTMCRAIDEPKPTMNYGWLTPQSDESELRRVVLHEFGHAIGLIHEHQNPEGGIDWNRPAVIADLSGPPNNWNEETIENNMFKKYEETELLLTRADKDSIMMYPIPKAWTNNGFSAGLNSEISEVDKQLVRTAYPR